MPQRDDFGFVADHLRRALREIQIASSLISKGERRNASGLHRSVASLLAHASDVDREARRVVAASKMAEQTPPRKVKVPDVE